MPKGYWIAQIDVQEPARYEAYRAAVGPALAAFGGRFVVRGGTAVVREGVSRARNVVVEFASLATAVACYDSPSYQQAKAIREEAAISDFVIVEGWDG
jgi:uncharacterized protein (DUF1330 family)